MGTRVVDRCRTASAAISAHLRRFRSAQYHQGDRSRGADGHRCYDAIGHSQSQAPGVRLLMYGEDSFVGRKRAMCCAHAFENGCLSDGR